jgi:hypothetical protein
MWERGMGLMPPNDDEDENAGFTPDSDRLRSFRTVSALLIIQRPVTNPSFSGLLLIDNSDVCSIIA